MKTKSLLALVGLLFCFIAQAQTAPIFNGGSRQTMTICQNSGANALDAKMVTTDPDAGQTLTYTIISAPTRGTVHGFPAVQGTGAGGTVSPTGSDYTPNTSYNGLDSFVIQVSDGSLSSTTKIVVTINPLPTVASITGSAATCIGNTSQLNNTTSGGVWSSDNIFVADVSNTGLVTGQAAGATIIRYTVTDGVTGCINAATVNFSVYGTPVVQPITGTTTVCVGSTTQLSSTTGGGVWTSNNTTRATVNASTGLVTGVGAGNVTIIYTVTNAGGCSNSVTTNVTVNAKPNIGTITANTTTLCAGSTTQLTIGSTGGTWSSSNTGVATVSNGGGGGGTVTGVAAGTVYIYYTITNANGCIAKDSVQMTVVNGTTVQPITGPTTVCVGRTITLSDATSGGTWSATPGFRATITQTGVLTANNAGNITVTYTVSGSCSSSVTYTVTASTTPSLAAITGSNQVCVGATTQLSNSTNGGVWSSLNPSIATISSTGLVTGVAAGNDTIQYKYTNAGGCSDSVRYAIAVTSSITVANITGANNVCLGSTLQLNDATSGGTWAVGDNTLGSITGTGLFIPFKVGVVQITYTVGSGACTAVASKNVIIYPSPTVGAIEGNTAICVGSTSQLTDTTAGGVWTISNSIPQAATISSTGLVTPNAITNPQTLAVTYTVTNSYGCAGTATTNVTINPKPTVQAIGGTYNATCVNTTILLTEATSGGVWYSSSNGLYTTIVPIGNNLSVTGNATGVDTIYYTVTNGNGCTTTVSKVITVSAALTVAPIVGSSTLCYSTNPPPITQTYTCATTGGTWASSNTAIFTVTTGGVATGIATGTATLSYTVNNGGACTASSTLSITTSLRPAVPTISGPTTVCVDTFITLTGNPAGGYWALQNQLQSNFLRVDSATGKCTGVAQSPGAVPVLYTVANAAGCTRSGTTNITVNAGAPISPIQPNGIVNVCVGSTTTLTDATPNGVWHSANTAIAKVDSVTGVVTGVAAGNTSITYVVDNATGCSSVAQKIVTVNNTPTVGVNNGNSTICVGSSTTFTNTVAGGTWSSTNTAVATVNGTGSSTQVTGTGAGNSYIIYRVSTGIGANACSASDSTLMTVHPVPSVAPIHSVPVGINGVCIGKTLQLANDSAGGIWGTSNINRATVSNTGLVTGVGAGSIIITYTVSNGTCSNTAFGNGTIYALPKVPAIAGPSAVCVGNTITLTNDSTGGVWSASNSKATISTSGVVTGVTAGTDTIYYKITNANGCDSTVSKVITINALPIVAAITGTTSVCVNATTTLSNTTVGGTWSSNNTAVATINSSGVVTGVSAGTATIRYIVTNGSGCSDSVSTTVTVNALPSIAAIAGNNSVCKGSSTTLTNATAGGSWSSSNTSVATITNAGVVSGLTAGTTTIKYKVTNASGCSDSVTLSFTVNALPTVAAITGTTTVCAGSTTTLANSTISGVWSSNNTAVATVNASGVVLGVAAGTTTIKYQVTNASGCIDSATTIVTVNALPTVAALTGNNSICVNATTTFASTTTGGTFSSSNTSIATVNATTGVVIGVAAGTATISYSITNANNCTKTVTRTVTVNALPTVTAITGASSVCVNSSITLSSTPTGGVWTSNNTAAATVNSSTGVVTGVAAGSTTITYTVTNANGCVTSVTKTITVNDLPLADFTTNNNTQCANTNSFVFTSTSTTASGTISSVLFNFGDASATSSSSPATHSYASAGFYTVKLIATNSSACKDSVVKTVLVKATSTSSTTQTVCDSLTWNGTKYTTSGTYTWTGTNSVGCDSVATLILTVKKSTTSTTTQTACNSYTWNGVTYTTSGTYTKHFTNAAGCDSTATLNLTVNYSSTSTTTQTACDTYTWNGTTYTTSGSYVKHFTNSVGCDSAATLNLTVNHSTTSSTNVSVCNNTLPFIWNGTNYSTSGSYVKHFTNSVGCDSAATLVFTVKDTTTSTSTQTACNSYTWNAVTYTTSGTYTKHFTNAAGCDSAATLHLTVKYSTTSNTTQTACDSYTWNGTTYTTSGVYTVHFTNAVGCDSAATLNLTVNYSTTSSTTQTACDSYTWNGTTYTTSGTYTKHFTNAAGCDSAATLHLTINYSSTSSTTQIACDSYTWNGVTYTTSGTYTKHFTNAAGCDSAATLHLTVNYSSTSNTTQTACDSYTWNGTTYTTSGVYTVHFTNATGCDSAATLNLTVNYSTTSSTTQTACDSYTWNGTTYTTSGTYTKHFTNAAGCDSAATLHLTINYSTTSSTSVAVCNNMLPYVWNGNNYLTAGSYTLHFTNAVGCDSAATLVLTIKDTTTSTTTVAVCNNTLPYVWNGTNYTASGTYTAMFTNAAGCDSTAYLVLTVKDTTTSTTNVSVCNNMLPYVWNGTNYTASGTYNKMFTNTAGCDSTAYLVLTVKDTTISTTNVTVCNNMLPYVWNATNYTASGTYNKMFTNAAGCDSIATLVLTVTDTTTSTTNTSVCNNMLPYVWNGTSYAASGTYSAMFTNAAGCDSTAYLVLTIKDTTTSTTTQTACDSYTWNGVTYTTSGTYSAMFTNAAGCDSTAYLTLTVNYSTTSTTNITICQNSLPYTWNGLTFNAAGSQTAHFTNAAGCDSAATLNLTVNVNTSSITNLTVCPSQVPYTWNGLTFNAAGTQTATLSNANGCDSLATLILDVKDTVPSFTTVAACVTYTWNGITYTTSGTYTYHTTAAAGCDSLATLYLTINQPTSSTTNSTVCNNMLPYVWNGNSYSTAGTYVVHIANVAGCDSAVTLILTISDTTTSSTNANVCSNMLPYVWNGNNYTASGTYTWKGTNAAGCDSVASLILAVVDTTISSTTVSACNTYTWNGTTYTASGTYTWKGTNAAGCDSVAYLILTINTGTFNTTTQTACDTYAWNGTTYTASGTYTYSYNNANGCASVDTLYLTINNGTHNVSTATACDTYAWNGTTYNASGTYTYSYNNANGCASVDTLYLTINHSTTSTTTKTVCNNMLPYVWNGNNYTATGTYTWRGTNAAGCDSLATLNLIVKDTIVVILHVQNCDSIVWNGMTLTTSGNYTWKGTNAAGCDSIVYMDLLIFASPAAPTITTATNNVTIPATGVAYACSTVSGATSYTWSYTGTGVTIASGQGTTNITADFAANATNGDIQVVAVGANGCTSVAANASIIVPIALNNFTANKVNKTAVLNWSSSVEINAAAYQIERSSDGRTFENIGVVTAKGTASEYRFIDTKPYAGVNYYRLKLVDKDGKYSYSVVRSVNFSATATFAINVYPNPATSVLNINSDANIYQIKILDVTGKMVYVTTTISQNGTTPINVSNLSKAIYFVEVTTTDGRREVVKFVKQ